MAEPAACTVIWSMFKWNFFGCRGAFVPGLPTTVHSHLMRGLQCYNLSIQHALYHGAIFSFKICTLSCQVELSMLRTRSKAPGH